MIFNLLTQYIVFYVKNNRYLGQKKSLEKMFFRCLFFKEWGFSRGISALKKAHFWLFKLPCLRVASHFYSKVIAAIRYVT